MSYRPTMRHKQNKGCHGQVEEPSSLGHNGNVTGNAFPFVPFGRRLPSAPFPIVNRPPDRQAYLLAQTSGLGAALDLSSDHKF
jgi:hypothetical protein